LPEHSQANKNLLIFPQQSWLKKTLKMVRLQGTPIAIDKFSFESGVFIYLLSHMHADHTSGLSESWDNGIIYCSHISRRLLIDKFEVHPDRVKALDINTPHTILLDRRIELDSPSKAILALQEVGESMTLTLVDADHCPGAVMFVLEGYFGRILYTGDFRYNPQIHSSSLLTAEPFDIVYIDNTYCNPASEFPSRAEISLKVQTVVTNHLDHDVIFIGIDNLGKEELLVEIAKHTNRPICVSPTRMRWLKLCEIETSFFTCDATATNIHVMLRRFVSSARVIAASPTNGVAIVPSGWPFTTSEGPSIPADLLARKFTGEVVNLPYSLHSSFSELKAFCATLSFAQILPITRGDFGSHLELLKPSPTASIVIRQTMGIRPRNVRSSAPPSVLEAMAKAKKRQLQRSRSDTFVTQKRKRLGVTFDFGDNIPNPLLNEDSQTNNQCMNANNGDHGQQLVEYTDAAADVEEDSAINNVDNNSGSQVQPMASLGQPIPFSLSSAVPVDAITQGNSRNTNDKVNNKVSVTRPTSTVSRLPLFMTTASVSPTPRAPPAPRPVLTLQRSTTQPPASKLPLFVTSKQPTHLAHKSSPRADKAELRKLLEKFREFID
jgi:DNA cross-link repair 1B protein